MGWDLAVGIKMFTKKDVIPAGADRALHTLAPFFSVFFALVTFAAIPFGDHVVWCGRVIDLQDAKIDVALLYVFAIALARRLRCDPRGVRLPQQLRHFGRSPRAMSVAPVAKAQGSKLARDDRGGVAGTVATFATDHPSIFPRAMSSNRCRASPMSRDSVSDPIA